MWIETTDPDNAKGPYTSETWEFDAPDVNWMLDYWCSLRVGAFCPRWSEVDLMANFRHARAMTVKDALEGGRDFYVRFWGEDLKNFLNFEATGKLLSAYYPQSDIDNALEAHRVALLGAAPVRRWGQSQFPDRRMATFEMILLPLSDDQGNRANVITYTAFNWGEGPRGQS